MTDYKAEQEMEIEALQAILMDDLVPYNGTLPDTWKAVGDSYKVAIDPIGEGEDPPEEEPPVKAELIFAHTERYPDEGPCLRLRSVRGLSDADLAEGLGVLQGAVEENLGMAMVYTLVTLAKDWLRGKMTSGPATDGEAERKKALEAEEQRRLEARAHGTHVTQETFAAWKAQFDAERAAAKARALEAVKDDEKAKRLSGKAWFLREAAQGHDIEGDGAEEGVLMEDDEEDFDDAEEGGMEENLDYDDDDDEGFLDDYMAKS